MDDYDEYGNYLGEALDGEEEEEEEEEDHDEEDEEERLVHPQSSSAIVLHEDKAIYPSASSVFGEDVEIVMDTEVVKSKTQPLLPREEVVRERRRTKPLQDSEDDKFDDFVKSSPDLVRTCAFVGHLHSGKSSLVRFLHRKRNESETKTSRTVNVRQDEQALKISIKLRPNSSSCADSRGKSFFVQSLDTPGHVNFADEVECALEACDGAVLCVDVVEGCLLGTEHCVASLRRHGLLGNTVVCLTKMDRLIHELKLPPADAQRKICNVLDALTALMDEEDISKRVLFSSAAHGWCVSLESMARLASSKQQGEEEDVSKLASFLSWQDSFFFSPSTREFTKKQQQKDSRKTFEYFVLEPIYKLYSHVLGEDPSKLTTSLLGLKLSVKEQGLDAIPLLKRVLQRTLPSGSACLVDALVRHVPSPLKNMEAKLAMSLRGGGQEDSTTSLLVHCVKLLFPGDDSNDLLDAEEESALAFGTEVSFRVLARVYSGTLAAGDTVFVREQQQGDNEDEDEDGVMRGTIKTIRLPSRGGGGSCRVVASAGPGTLVLVSGVDSLVTKSATLSKDRKQRPFLPLRLFSLKRTRPVCKLAIEPLVPAELPKMLTGLRACQRSFPALQVQVEESGEYVLFGTGELYLDAVMRDLRERFAKGTEIKVVDPFVSLCETVTETSNLKTTGDGFSLICTPLEEKLVEALESGRVVSSSAMPLDKLLKKEYGYDILASRSVWAFGPNPSTGSNAFLDETLMDPTELEPVKDGIVQGFRWACREGPLCGEPVRGVKFKLLDASVHAGGQGQVIKTLRRLSHQTMLRSSPALYEPVFAFDAVLADNRAINLVKKTLEARRGGWGELSVIPGTPLHRFCGWVPVLDSYGMETELRLRSRGNVYCQMYFDRWKLVPGDPLDDSVSLRPLEPSPTEFLARDLVVKTRRRKGLPESIETANVLDQQILQDLVNGGGGV